LFASLDSRRGGSYTLTHRVNIACYKEPTMTLETIKTTFVDLRTRASVSFADATGKVRGRFGELAGGLRSRLEIPTADDFRRLRTRVEELAARIDRLARRPE